MSLRGGLVSVGGSEYWPLIGPERSRDLDTGLSLVSVGGSVASATHSRDAMYHYGTHFSDLITA